MALLRTPSNESQGQISPSEKWLAYYSNEPGTPRAFLRPFGGRSPGSDTQWQHSTVFGVEPRWQADGKELFYLGTGHWDSAAQGHLRADRCGADSRSRTSSITVAREHPTARRLQEVPGVGGLTSTALVGAVGHIHAFRRGRQFASWLGLTPRESSTGSRRYLGRISKRGDVYLRCWLTHGARAVLLTAQRSAT